MNKLSNKQHKERFDLMMSRLPMRVRLEVRDVMNTLGFTSSSHAYIEIMKWVDMGLIEYEPPAEGHHYGVFYLKLEKK